jgi:hypothetical protein
LITESLIAGAGSEETRSVAAGVVRKPWFGTSPGFMASCSINPRGLGEAHLEALNDGTLTTKVKV